MQFCGQMFDRNGVKKAASCQFHRVKIVLIIKKRSYKVVTGGLARHPFYGCRCG
jgi:hypothetical protein